MGKHIPGILFGLKCLQFSGLSALSQCRLALSHISQNAFRLNRPQRTNITLLEFWLVVIHERERVIMTMKPKEREREFLFAACVIHVAAVHSGLLRLHFITLIGDNCSLLVFFTHIFNFFILFSFSYSRTLMLQTNRV